MGKTTPRKDWLRFTSILERSTNKLWGAHFSVPNRIAKKLIDGESRRVICMLNGTAEHQCALIPFGNGSFVITVNKSLRDKLKLTFGMEASVSLKKDTSVYGLPMPEELNELLKQDSEGNKVFHALTRGKQRVLLYIIGSAKNSEKRVVRAITIVKHLKENHGKINHKQLAIMLKNPWREHQPRKPRT